MLAGGADGNGHTRVICGVAVLASGVGAGPGGTGRSARSSRARSCSTSVPSGTDLLIAAQMTGADGRAIGVDMTRAMFDRAASSAWRMGLRNVELHEGLIEALPIDDASVDVVISNGVIDLVPDKEAAFAEIDRVLRPGGRVQVADVIIHTAVSEDARQRIDMWTG
jgi:arsenite methyltransferase